MFACVNLILLTVFFSKIIITHRLIFVNTDCFVNNDESPPVIFCANDKGASKAGFGIIRRAGGSASIC